MKDALSVRFLSLAPHSALACAWLSDRSGVAQLISPEPLCAAV